MSSDLNNSIFIDVQADPLDLKIASDFVNHPDAGAVNISAPGKITVGALMGDFLLII